jgi:hypothetical protein
LLLKKCREILGGAVLPGEEQQHYERDIQFELYVNGTLGAGGFRPRLDEQPDIRFDLGTEDVGVAVKRIWSRDQAHKKLSDAAGPEASRVRGIVGTTSSSISTSFPPTNRSRYADSRSTNRWHDSTDSFPYLFGKKHITPCEHRRIGDVDVKQAFASRGGSELPAASRPPVSTLE